MTSLLQHLLHVPGTVVLLAGFLASIGDLAAPTLEPQPTTP